MVEDAVKVIGDESSSEDPGKGRASAEPPSDGEEDHLGASASPTLPTINWDEDPRWTADENWEPLFDPISEFTQGTITYSRLLDLLVGRRPEDEALVVAILQLTYAAAFHEVNLAWPSTRDLDCYPGYEPRLRRRVLGSWKSDLARCKYPMHYIDIFATMSQHIIVEIRMDLADEARRSARRASMAKTPESDGSDLTSSAHQLDLRAGLIASV